MKKFVCSFMFSLVILFTVVGAFSHVSASSSKLFLNSEPLKTDVNPIIENGVTLVPLAVISQGLGQDILWDGKARQVTITAPDLVIQLSIGSKIAKVNNVEVELPLAARLFESRTMVPIRFISENLGLTVNYITNTKEIHIISHDINVPPSPSPTPAPSPVPTPTPGPTPTPVPTAPGTNTQAKALINDIIVDDKQSIHIHYKGEISQPKVQELTEPRRLIVDLPNADYSEGIYKQFINGQTQVIIEQSSFYTAYRYALFNRDPLTSRVVVELKADTKYQLKHENGKLTIVFGDLVNPNEPVVPNLLVYVDDIISDYPNKIYHIVLDPGHGNQDPGAINKNKGLYEKTFNLSFGLKLKAELEKYNRIKVHMTRSDDTYLTLDERILFAESIPQLNSRADIFISIHANSFTRPDVNGVETYYYNSNSKSLAEKVHPAIVNAMGLNDRKVRTAGFKVIKNALMPAILLEVGYMSNETDVERLFDTNRQDKLAADVARSVAEYLKLK